MPDPAWRMTHDEAIALINDCDSRKLNEWELGFMIEVLKHLKSGGLITPDQRAKIQEIHDKSTDKKEPTMSKTITLATSEDKDVRQALRDSDPVLRRQAVALLMLLPPDSAMPTPSQARGWGIDEWAAWAKPYGFGPRTRHSKGGWQITHRSHDTLTISVASVVADSHAMNIASQVRATVKGLLDQGELVVRTTLESDPELTNIERLCATLLNDNLLKNHAEQFQPHRLVDEKTKEVLRDTITVLVGRLKIGNRELLKRAGLSATAADGLLMLMPTPTCPRADLVDSLMPPLRRMLDETDRDLPEQPAPAPYDTGKRSAIPDVIAYEPAYEHPALEQLAALHKTVFDLVGEKGSAADFATLQAKHDQLLRDQADLVATLKQVQELIGGNDFMALADGVRKAREAIDTALKVTA